MDYADYFLCELLSPALKQTTLTARKIKHVFIVH